MGVCPAYLGMSQRKSELGWLWLLRAAMLKIRDVDYCVQQVASHDYTTLRASFRRRRCKAVLMQSLNVEASNGFRRKQTAPAAMARSRTSVVGNAVRKMIGRRYPCEANRRCSSRPSTCGICTSLTTRKVRASSGDRKNSSEEGKLRAGQPSDRTSLSVAILAEASSSTIETISWSNNWSPTMNASRAAIAAARPAF